MANTAIPNAELSRSNAQFQPHVLVDELKQIAGGQTPLTDRKIAEALDAKDPLAELRKGYILPTMRDVGAGQSSNPDGPSLYLCGNSLGPLARRSRKLLHEEIDVWGGRGVIGHFDHPHGRPWVRNEERVGRIMADIVGAKPSEVVAMSTLTQNLHTMLATFYRPLILSSGASAAAAAAGSTHLQSKPSTKRRHKIVYEAKAFPSDQYALASAVLLHGLDPRESLHAIHPRDGEHTLKTEDVIQTLEKLAEEGETALVLLGGIQYFTGQWFEMRKITKRAKELDLIVGWDLAHAFANVPLALHDWDVDFAVWCTYKYGSSGPGGIAGAFVHERWGQIGMQGKEGLIRPAGWWGHDKSTRFSMPDDFVPIPGAAGWQVSNPSALDMTSLLGSLETLSRAAQLVSSHPGQSDSSNSDSDIGSPDWATSLEKRSTLGEGTIMPILRHKSLRLTAYLEYLLLAPGFLPTGCEVSIVTPSDPQQRGSQLSIRIPDPATSPRSPPVAGDTGDAAGDAHATTNGAPEKQHVLPPPTKRTTLVSRVHSRAERSRGLVSDVRNPDMLRLAPLAQYSSFCDVWDAADALREALEVELA